MTDTSPPPRVKVGLSTASVYPEGTAVAFELAARLGYDGVEVMVWTDPTSQDPYALLRLSQHYQVPILAIHAPCLIITQRVWTTDAGDHAIMSVRSVEFDEAPAAAGEAA